MIKKLLSWIRSRKLDIGRNYWHGSSGGNWRELKNWEVKKGEAKYVGKAAEHNNINLIN